MRSVAVLMLLLVGLLAGGVATATVASAAPAAPTAPKSPSAPSTPSGDSTSGDSTDSPSVSVKLGGNKPSSSITTLMLITLLAVAPSLLLLVTSFTKIFVVLSLTRNALGLQSVPPNQVLAGLSLFLSLFVMGPVVQTHYRARG